MFYHTLKCAMFYFVHHLCLSRRPRPETETLRMGTQSISCVAACLVGVLRSGHNGL